MTTTTTRIEIAEKAYIDCYATLKADSKDALLAMNYALYSHISREDINAMWAHHGTLEEVADTLWETECDGTSEADIASEYVAVIDDAMSGFLFTEATDRGIDVEEERCDWHLLAEELHATRTSA